MGGELRYRLLKYTPTMVVRMVVRITIHHVTIASLNGTIDIWCYFRCKTSIYVNREMGDEMRYRLQKYPLQWQYMMSPLHRSTELLQYSGTFVALCT